MLGERFWSKVGKADALDCWLWTASVNDRGYGQYRMPDRAAPYRAHRLAYEELVGEIPNGLVLDHLCRNRACVNPYHLEPVTHKVNINRGVGSERASAWQRAKTHCPSGHEYTPENTRMHKRGYRTCITCDRARCLANYYKRKASA